MRQIIGININRPLIGLSPYPGTMLDTLQL